MAFKLGFGHWYGSRRVGGGRQCYIDGGKPGQYGYGLQSSPYSWVNGAPYVGDVGGTDTYVAGARFSNVTVPRGAVITSATLAFLVEDVTAPMTLECKARVSHKNAPAFSTGNGNNTAGSTWTAAAATLAVSTTGAKTVDVTSVISEWLGSTFGDGSTSDGVWGPGGALALRLKDTAPVTDRTATLGADAASMVLTINWDYLGGTDVADYGQLLIDFAQQSTTVGVSTAYTNTFGSYTAARAAQSHDPNIVSPSETQTATGWEMQCTGNLTPGTAREMRYRVNFSTALDLSGATNFQVELEYPQEMLPADFGQSFYVGIRMAFVSASGNQWQAPTMWQSQGILKQRRVVLSIPASAKTSGLWTVASGSTATWTAITGIILYLYTGGTNGGMRVTIRKLWANRVGRKALVAFTFDDNMRGVHTNARPIFTANRMRGGVAVISSTAQAESDPTIMWGAHLTDLYNDGWSMYNHHRAAADVLEATLAGAATPWVSGRLYFTTSAAVYADATVGEYYEIRGGWGPEVNGVRKLLAKSAGNTLEFEAATAPAGNSSGYQNRARMNWPGLTRAQRLANEVAPCTAYLESMFGAGYRGRTVYIAPQGDYDVDWSGDLAGAGFSYVRNTTKHYNATEAGSPWYTVAGIPMTQGCNDPFDGAGISIDNLDNTAGNQNLLKGYVDAAIANGEFVHFYGHKVEATHGSLQVHKDLLSYIVGYVRSKIDAGQAENVTVDTIAQRYPWS